MMKHSKSGKNRGFMRASIALTAIGAVVAGAALFSGHRHSEAPIPKLFGASHAHSKDCLHSDAETNGLQATLNARAYVPTESCKHFPDGTVIEYKTPHLLEAIALTQPSRATFYSKEGRPVLSVCFEPGTPQEVVDAHMERMRNQENGAWPNPLDDYQTDSQWGTQGTPITLRWSFVPDGLSIMGYNFEPTSNSVLFANLDADYAAQGGRSTWVNRFVQSYNRWDQLSGLTLTRVTSGGNDWDDGANFDTADGSAVRGELRIGGHSIDGASNILAYNFFPGAQVGGNMVIDTDDNWGSTTNQNLRLRNVIMHEAGHGIGMDHVCPLSVTKLMEPFLATTFDGPQHDEIRHVQRLYGDPLETNDTAALASPMGAFAIPSTLNNFEDVPATVSGINPTDASRLSIDASGDVDFYSFTVGNSCNVAVTVSPIGLTYGDNAQNANCTQTASTNSLNQSNLGLEIIAPNGSTVLASGLVNPAGSSESATAAIPNAGTYFIRVFSQNAITQSQLYGFDITTSAANNPVPFLNSITPNVGIAGLGAFTLTALGNNFVPGSVVRWNGSDRPTTYVSGLNLSASITAADIATAGSATVTVFNPGPGGGLSGGVTFSINNPVPVVTTISPTSTTAGSAAFTLTVNGTNFRAGSVVRWNGLNRTTTFVSINQLTASISAADVANAGTASVTVFNPVPGGGTSGAATFTINNPVPTLTTISPTSATAGGAAFTLTVNGTNFNSNSIVRWNGANRTTTFVSATQLTASISAADIATAGTQPVTVFNPTPGGGTSGSATFTINNPVPTLTSISPTSATAGGAAFTLTVNGTNFNSQSVVRWNGSARTTTFVSATQVTAAITAADIATAGSVPVSVNNPAPGGGTSGSLTFTVVNPAPTVTTISPNSATAGGAAFSMTVNGTGFNASSVVRLNGSNRTTTFVSATQLTASITAADISSASVSSITVFNPTPGGGLSNSATFTINNPAPGITTISPNSALVGGAGFTLTVTGTGFNSQSIVRWNGVNRTTTFVSATQLTAAIPASDITTIGTRTVTVTNPAPGGGTSLGFVFTVLNPVPTLASISPASVFVGGPNFTLTCNGTNFNSTSVVRVNGVARATTFVSATQVTATVLASDIATTGVRSITVSNPTPGGGLTGTLNLLVNPRTFSGVVNLQGWVGDPSIVPITFRIRPVGGAPGSEIATVTVNLSPTSTFVFNAPVGPGNYDILADGSIWLQQNLSNVAVTSGSTTGLNYNLIVGDIDGDEAITPSDYGIWALNNGSFVTAGTNGDLDGDEAVTPSDYGLWALNNGTLGDP